MELKVFVVQPVPYEPCHGRPDSQPARPRLPPGCGSQTRSSLSAGAPRPLHTLDLTHTDSKDRLSGFSHVHVLHNSLFIP